MFDEYIKSLAEHRTASSPAIHPSAIVEPGAEIGDRVNIGPFSIIKSGARIGNDVWIDSHVTVGGTTTIGERTRIYQFATIGVFPQDLKFRGEAAKLVIGSDNVIREYVNISIGTEDGGGLTEIGNQNLFMVYCHIGHDTVN